MDNINAEKENINSEEISVKEMVEKVKSLGRFLYTKKIYILICAIVGGVLGLTYAYIKKPVYTAEYTFVIEEQSKGGLGQYAGLASMVGIDLGGAGGGSGLFQGDNIIQLYQSKKMLREALLSEAVFAGKKQRLIDRFIESNKLKKKWDNEPGLKNLEFSIDTTRYTIKHDSIIFEVIKSIRKSYLNVGKPDKKLSIISISVVSKDQLFAKEFAHRVVETVNQAYIVQRTTRAKDNVRILQQQADSVRRELSRSLRGTANEMDANPNPNSAMSRLRVGSQERQVDVQANGAIYAEVVKNLELSRMTMLKETPFLQIIDSPRLPLEEAKVGKLLGLLVGIILGLFFSVAYFIAKSIIA